MHRIDRHGAAHFEKYDFRRRAAKARHTQMKRRMKFCPACKTEKPTSLFFKNRARSDGITSQCKVCHSSASRANQGARWAMAKRRTGIGKDEYERLFIAQSGLCAICKSPPTAKGYRYGNDSPLLIDHCHSTGKVRGLLCLHCNSGLGFFRDNPEIMAVAITYLKQP